MKSIKLQAKENDKITLIIVIVAMVSFVVLAYIIHADANDNTTPNYLEEVVNEGYYYRSLISINEADVNDLDIIPGIGPALAGRIIEYREENGNFKELEDLKEVRGIGDKTFLELKSYIEL